MRLRDENKELSIREHALAMIVREGFDGLSMQKLARAAGVSPATIYIYFKNREDLLNQLFIDVQQTFADTALKGFDPELSFEEGLWIQWKNRFKFILKYPAYYLFHEQFRNSPLINHKDIKIGPFKESMKHFLLNAIRRGEMKKMEPEVFWSIAYGPFYLLVQFHTQEKTMMNNKFTLTEARMRQAFDMVIKAFRP